MQLQDRLGAWLTPAGCFFRVWAPNATGVAVLLQTGPYWETGDVIHRQELTPNNAGCAEHADTKTVRQDLETFQLKNSAARLAARTAVASWSRSARRALRLPAG